ncbi:WYL domain-containing protein [Ramlibacter sp. USB13]|uniref:WYL domain-containing protein n=1 Tax=Ramlibacter cellulosilyticus TaxID=2764187 RepID=A0A923S9E3_9BURK|nr:WYL domain-containing protein [Ramlibacter cellulosilyticus]MBC5781570.1 WYL domain-containing protein [Ramlibacter cellulosilyticus]
MRASRLLSIQMMLETHGRMSATALARALDVSVRTLHRDIDELTSAGVPVYAERGRAGGFQLLPGWKTTLTGFTSGEAEAVFLAGLAGPATELGLGPQVASAERKLLAALPAPWRGSARRIRSRLHLDPVEWYREAEPVPFLPVVARAVWEERQLAMSYESWSRTARRTVDPLGLVMKAGTWYFAAGREGKVRTWRVASVLDAALLDTPVQRPRGFELADYWRASVRRFEVELFSGEAVVLATRRGLAELRRINAALARAVATAASPAEGERVELRIPIESVPHAAGQLLRLCPEVEVRAPRELREAIRERAHVAARMYGTR